MQVYKFMKCSKIAFVFALISTVVVMSAFSMDWIERKGQCGFGLKPVTPDMLEP